MARILFLEYPKCSTCKKAKKWLDEQGYEIVSGESVRIPTDTKELDAEGREAVEKLVEKLEEDDDVVNVYHTMAEVDEE